MSNHHVCRRVVSLTWEHGVDHGLGADVQEGGEGVGELDDTDGADDADEGVEVGDHSADDECQGPVDGNHDDPEDFAFFGGEFGHAEDLDTDIVVDD